MVEQVAVNHPVAGSSPARGANKNKDLAPSVLSLFLCCAPPVHHGLRTGSPRLGSGAQTYRNKFELKELLRAIFAERRKSRHEATEPHIVPLTEFHLKMLQKVRGVTEHLEWLFPHKNRQQPRKPDALYQATYRFCRSNVIEPFALRDCRRTFKSLAGSIGIDLELRNRLQGHAMPDVGSVHYDRWSYLPEKRGNIRVRISRRCIVRFP